jgi:hypothetical protein
VVHSDAVESAFAVTRAATAGRFDVVAEPARQLDARRLARGADVLSIIDR